MAWSEIGSVKLTYDWQFLIWSFSEQGIFRIRQTWDNRPVGKGLIAQAYGDNPYQFFGYEGFYPSQESKIIHLPIPTDFLDLGLVPSYLGLKLARRTRVFDFNWQISIDAFET